MNKIFDLNGKEYVDKRMDLIGLGTYEIRSEETIYKVLDAALKIGYRFIDTAQVYRNEKFIGKALKTLLPKYNLTREDIFITSKLDPANQGKEKCLKSIEESLENLEIDYLDLFLIHWPGASKLDGKNQKNKELRLESWKCMEMKYFEKKLRSIGVSNFNIVHMEELLNYSTVLPAVNQCEYHPYYYQDDLVKFCRTNNIHFQAYSSFGSASNKTELFSDKKICAMAKKYNTTVTNFLLAWSICQGISVLPRSCNPEHVTANYTKNLKISADDIEAVKCEKIKKFCWDPVTIC